MISFKKLFLLLGSLLVFVLINGCTTTTSQIPTNNFTQGKSSLSADIPVYLSNYKTPLVTLSGVSENLVSTYFVKRDSTFSTPILTTATGTQIQNTDNKFIKLLCFDNPKYASINTNSSINGWASVGVNHIFSSSLTGIVRNVNGQLNATTAISLSFTITFFPDGIYTIVNHVDETLNQIGHYQPVIEKEIMTGIIYKQARVGINFTRIFDSTIPNFTTNALSYGVWGIDENFFFPLFLIDINDTVFLRMRKHSY